MLDEDEDQLEYLKIKLKGIPWVEVVKVFLDPGKFVSEINVLPHFDVLISDIDMPGIDGFEVASQIAPKPVLFVTGFPDKGIDYGSILNAIGVLKKPVKLDALQRWLEKVPVAMNTLALRTDRAKMEEINVEQISYIKTDSDEPRDKVIVFRDGTALKAKDVSLDDLVEMSGNTNLLKANKKQIINTQHITGLVSVNEIGIAVGKEIVPIEMNPAQKETISALKPHLFRSR